jgi:hypothetical protein
MENPVEESERHAQRSSRASSTAAKPHVNAVDEVSGTHRAQTHPSPMSAAYGCRSGLAMRGRPGGEEMAVVLPTQVPVSGAVRL